MKGNFRYQDYAQRHCVSGYKGIERADKCAIGFEAAANETIAGGGIIVKIRYLESAARFYKHRVVLGLVRVFRTKSVCKRYGLYSYQLSLWKLGL